MGPFDGKDSMTLMKHADIAMYQAKNQEEILSIFIKKKLKNNAFFMK